MIQSTVTVSVCKVDMYIIEEVALQPLSTVTYGSLVGQNMPGNTCDILILRRMQTNRFVYAMFCQEKIMSRPDCSIGRWC